MKKTLKNGLRRLIPLMLVAALLCGMTPVLAADEPELVSDEFVVLEEDDYSMTVTAIENDDLWGYTWTVSIVNNTDKELMFAFNAVSVNGLMADPLWSEDVPAGETVESEVNWYDLPEEIELATAIRGTLDIYDYDTFDDVYVDTFAVYPYGEDEAVTYTREAEDTDVVLLDDDGVKVSVIEADTDDMLADYAFTMYIENNTDETLMFALDDVSVNGIMCDPLCAEDVAPGMVALTECSWYADFESLGIDEVTWIEGTLDVYDTDTYDEIYYDTVDYYPNGEDNAVTVERESQDSDVVLIDNDDVTVTYVGMYDDDYDDTNMTLFIENKTDKALTFSLDDVTVNGEECDPYWARTVAAGKIALYDVCWYSSTLEDAGIEGADDFEEITAAMTVYEKSTFDDILEEDITVNP